MVENTTVIKTAKPLAFKPLSEKELAAKYASRVRKGKTARDKAKKVRTSDD